jgi:hypothetical protein
MNNLKCELFLYLTFLKFEPFSTSEHFLKSKFTLSSEQFLKFEL